MQLDHAKNPDSEPANDRPVSEQEIREAGDADEKQQQSGMAVRRHPES
jgi:hypothetical protein